VAIITPNVKRRGSGESRAIVAARIREERYAENEKKSDTQNSLSPPDQEKRVLLSVDCASRGIWYFRETKRYI